MKTQDELLKHSEYLRELKPLLPDGAFRRNPRKLFAIALHVVVVAGCFIVLRRMESYWLHALTALVLGHSIACLGLYAHDLSHKTILPGGPALRVLETLVWTVVGVPTTIWRVVHNATHHHETNTLLDPDRLLSREEKEALIPGYKTLFPQDTPGIKSNPLVGLQFFPFYLLRNLLASFFKAECKPAFVPAVPKYSGGQRLTIGFEVLLIAVYQWGVFNLVGGDWMKFVWASPVAFGIASATLMIYIFTNHFLNPLCEHTDPVAGSTSVKVPSWVDWIHSNFSYHTEHHLFPGMDSSHFPEVKALLEQKYPERYNRLPLGEAWKLLWNNEGYLR